MATQFEHKSVFASSETSQLSSTGDHDQAGIANRTSSGKASATRCTRSHYKLDEATEGCILDASQYAMAKPCLEDEPVDREWEALEAQFSLDQNAQRCGQSNNELSSNPPAYDQQEMALPHTWSDPEPYSDSLWTDQSPVGGNTDFNDLPLENIRTAYSPPAAAEAHLAIKPVIRPGLYLEMSSSSTTSTVSSEALLFAPSHPASLSSPIFSVAEKPSEELQPYASRNLASCKPSCLTAALRSATIEDDLSTSSQKRRSNTGDRQHGSLKRSRNSPSPNKARHSLVEKRYRTKLNDELVRLRKNVPSLRVLPKKPEEYAYREGKEKLERPKASSKFDKATIVSKAIEYITYIEMCNKRLSEEHVALVDRLSAIETMASGGG